MGLFDFLGKSKRQKEIDKIIEKSKEYLQQGEPYYAYVELKDIIYGKTEDDKTYRKDEVAALYAESQKDVRSGERLKNLKSEAEQTATECYEKALAEGMTEGEALYTAAKQIDLGDKKPRDETQAVPWQKQMAEAYKWYEKAVEKGVEEAILRYAKMSEKGLGTERNEEKAFLLYQKQAEQGSIEGKYELAGCYYFGKGVTRNSKKALELYETAAEQGHVGAQEMCGYLYLYGYGNYVDYEKAYRWYKKSEENGREVTNSWYKKEKELRKGKEDEELKKDKKDRRIEKAKQLIAQEKYHEVLNLLDNDYNYAEDDPVAGYRFEDAEELYLLCENTIAQAAKEAEWQASRELYIATYGEDPWAQTDNAEEEEEEETEYHRKHREYKEALLKKYDKAYGFDRQTKKYPMFRWGKSAEQWFEEGKKYFYYKGDKTEIARALECYEKAAIMGHKEAMVCCKDILYKIEGDESENAQYWRYKKKQYEDSESICSDAFLDAILTAHKAEDDNKRGLWREARQLARKAIDMNDSVAMVEYAAMYLAGEGVPEDKRVGYYWLERAAKVSPLTEVHKTFVFLQMRDMDSPFFDREKTLYWARKGAFSGDKDMMLIVAALYKQDEDNQSALLEALAWAEKAVEKGVEKDAATIMYHIGILCLKTKKYRRAVNWFEKSAKLGDTDAEEMLENLRECSDEIPQEEEAPPPPPKPITEKEEETFEPERWASAGGLDWVSGEC